MNDSQMFFWFSIAGVCAWGPILVLVWLFKAGEQDPSPWETLSVDLKAGFKVLVDRWPGFKTGQKHFMIATSFSVGALVLATSWAGTHAAQWASITLGGMSVEDASIRPPLGSWLTTWLIQITLIVCFYAWLEFRPKQNIER